MQLKRRWSQWAKKEKKAVRREILQKRSVIRELKRYPCQDCKQEYPSEAMDFDHVPGRGGKLGEVGSRPSVRAVLEEARKCDLVCANCHRVRTEKRRRGKKLERQERAQFLDGLVAAVEREREALKGLVGD